MWNNLKNGASDAWTGIKNVFSHIADWFKDKFSQAWQAVKDVFSTGGEVFTGIVDGIEEAFKNTVNAIINGINHVIAIPFNAINDALDTIRNVSIAGIHPFDGLISRFDVPQIPQLAKGGIVNKATLAQIGEDGEEAVLPLEKNKAGLKKSHRCLQKRWADLAEVINPAHMVELCIISHSITTVRKHCLDTNCTDKPRTCLEQEVMHNVLLKS